MATRRPLYQKPQRPKSTLAAPEYAGPSRHSTQWFTDHLIGVLKLYAKDSNCNLADVLGGLNQHEVHRLNLDTEGLQDLIDSTLEREREERRKLIISAASKLSHGELDALGISVEASRVLNEESCTEDESPLDDE